MYKKPYGNFVHIYLDRSGEEYVECDLCAIIIQGDDLPTRLGSLAVWLEKSVLARRHEADRREAWFGIVLSHAPSISTMPNTPSRNINLTEPSMLIFTKVWQEKAKHESMLKEKLNHMI